MDDEWDPEFVKELADEMGIDLSTLDLSAFDGSGAARRGDGKRALDDATKTSVLRATRDLPRDIQEQVIHHARADLVVGADACANASCAKKGEKRCARCKVVRYGSKACQRADWTAHKLRCAASDGTPGARSNADANAGGRAASAAPTMHFHMSAQALMDQFQAPETGGWYGGVSRQRVYERLVLSFCFRVEDEFKYAGNYVGVMRAAFEDENLEDPFDTSIMVEFRDYVKRGKTKGYLPKDWSDEDDRKVCEFAARADGVCTSWEKSDIVEKFGYGSGEHFVLRRLAESFLGPIGHWL